MRITTIILSIFFLCLISQERIYANDFYVGIKGGFGINYTGYPDSTDDTINNTDAILSPSAGLALEYRHYFKKTGLHLGFGLELDALYQSRGGSFTSGIVRSQYLGIPFVGRFWVGRYFHVGGGINYQYLLKSNSSAVRDINFELLGELGFSAGLTDHLNATLDLRFYGGVLNYTNNSSTSYKTRSGEIMIGLMYNL